MVRARILRCKVHGERCYKKKTLKSQNSNFNFKKAQICDTETNIWLKVISHCKECGSSFQGHCLKKPLPGQGISIQVTVSDARVEPHFKKGHLNGEARLIAGEKLLVKAPSTYRKELTKFSTPTSFKKITRRSHK